MSVETKEDGNGNWQKYQYNGKNEPTNAAEVVEQYTGDEAHSMIKTLCVIHRAFDIIVDRCRDEVGLVGGRAGISQIFNLNLQKYISWNTRNNPDELLSNILFPGKVTDEEGATYPLGLVGYCDVDGRQQLCQIISPYDKVRHDNVNAVKKNKGTNIKKLAKDLTVDANAWLQTDWYTRTLRDINSISDPLYVQVLTKSGGTTKGEKVYTVLGGEIQLALNDNTPIGFSPANFRLLPTEEKMRSWKTASGAGNNPAAQGIIDEMNPIDFEVGVVSQGETERRVLNDTLSRNAEGNYKPHGALDKQEAFAQNMIEGGKSILAVPTTAIDGDLYCILCKKGIEKKTPAQIAAIKKKWKKTGDVPIWKLQKYEVDHIFNLIFNTLCNLNGGPGGFFDTCSSCNQTFKSEKLWCPNYDIWDGLLRRMLEIYDPKLGWNIEKLRNKYRWPGLKCQGVTISKHQNRAPYGGWRTFITGWSSEEEKEEDAVLAQLAGDFEVTVNKGEFGKAQALKYTGGSNRHVVPLGAAGYLSTYVLQDCFLRRVLYVVDPNRDRGDKNQMGATMRECVGGECEAGAQALASSFAQSTIAMMAAWKKMKEGAVMRMASLRHKMKKTPRSPSAKEAEAAKEASPKTPENQPYQEIAMPLSQGTKKLWGKGPLSKELRVMRRGDYAVSKVGEAVADNLETLGGIGNSEVGELSYTRYLNNLKENIKTIKNKLKKWGNISLKANAIKKKEKLLEQLKQEYKRVLSEYVLWVKKEKKRLREQAQGFKLNFSSSEEDDDDDSSDQMHISDEEEVNNAVMTLECKTPGGGNPSFGVESMEGEIRALREWFASEDGGVGLGETEPYDWAKSTKVAGDDLINTEKTANGRPIHWWSGQLMLEALNSFCPRCNWQTVKTTVGDDSNDEDVICIFEDRNSTGKTVNTTDIKIELNYGHWTISVRPSEGGNLTPMPSVGDETHTVYAHHRNNGDCGPAAVALAIRACNDMDQLTQGMMLAVARNAELAKAQARELERLAWIQNAKNEKERTKAKFKQKISSGIQVLLRDKNAEKGLPLNQIKKKLYEKQIGKRNDLPNDNDLGTEFLTYINGVLTDLMEAGKVEQVGRSTHNPTYKLIIKKRGMSDSSSGASASLKKKSKEGGKSKTKGGKRTRKKRRRKKKSRRKRKYRKKTKKRKRRRKKRTRRK